MRTNASVINQSPKQLKWLRAFPIGTLLLCLTSSQSLAQSYRILHTFGTNVMGLNPRSTLVQGPDGALYGTTEGGGLANRGQVFKVNPDGTGYTALKNFMGPDGAAPGAGLVLSGTTLYGTTGGGGSADNGTIFKLNTDGSGFAVLKHFTGDDGGDPYAELTLSGTVLYGTTQGGGAFGCGTVFKIDTNGGGYAVLKHFNYDVDGATPQGRLLVSGSALYGTAASGGNSWNGTVFRLSTDGTGFTVLKHFTGAFDGGSPCGGVVISGESFYGTTSGGGTSGYGNVFKLNIDGSGFTVLKDFTNWTDGANCYAGLLLNGTTLYGIAAWGGSSGNGTVFKLNTDGSGFTVLKDFTNSTDGANCYAGLLLSGTALYGSASCGGAKGYGSLFKLQTDGGGFEVLTNFAGNDGAGPVGGLLSASTNFYGTTANGGAAGLGTLFRVNSDGTGYTILKSFTNPLEGASPQGDLVLSGDTLYGATSSGGSAGNGVLFKLNTDGSDYIVLKDFTNRLEGASVNGGLVLADGVLYGTAALGGSNDSGVVFKINTDGTGFELLHIFPLADWTHSNPTSPDGLYPQGLLTLSGATLFGTAWAGGTNGFGTLFKLNTDGSGFSVIKDFDGRDAGYPSGGFTIAGETLYGTTAWGGNIWGGTVFKISTDGSDFSVLRTFYNLDGGGPQGRLTLSNSVLYGAATWGGLTGGGVLFEIGTDGNNFTVLKQFTGRDGSGPNGGLILAGTTLCGTANGGQLDSGVLFKLSLLPAAPEIQLQPQSQSAPMHSYISFLAAADGIPELVCQWFFNGDPINDGTNWILYVDDVQQAQAGDYWAVISNSSGSVTSVVATLTVNNPFINSPPASQYALAGATVSFSVDAGGTDPLIFQWFKDGITLVDTPTAIGAQTAMLTLTNVTAANAGWYSVVVTNDFGSVTSTPVLFVVQDPSFTAQPSGQIAYIGSTARLVAAAAGTQPLNYQWQKDGTNLSNGRLISGADSPMLTIANASVADAGLYSAVVSNAVGSLTSSPAALRVVFPPPSSGAGTLAVVDVEMDTWGAQCVDEATFMFSVNKAVWIFEDLRLTTNDVGRLFTMNELADPDFSRLVSFLTNGNPDSIVYYMAGGGAGTSEHDFFSLPAGQVDFQGFIIDNISLYIDRLTITHNNGGTDVSFRGKIYVNSEPWQSPGVLVPPTAQTAELGSSVGFSVQAFGFPAPAYFWYFNNEPIIDSTNRFLWLSNVQPSNVGGYSVVAMNPFGSVPIGPAMLQVIAPVERRPVPAISVTGDPGSLLNLDYADSLTPLPNWLPLDTVSLVSTSQLYFDLTVPLPSQRFYRAWQTQTPSVLPALSLPGMVPALTLTGAIGDNVRVDAIHQIGPTDAWFTLATVTLTNTTQLYFDTTAPGQPPRLYRLNPLP